MSDESNFVHCSDCGKSVGRIKTNNHTCTDVGKNNKLRKNQAITVPNTDKLKVTKIGDKTEVENSAEKLPSSSLKEEQEQINLQNSTNDEPSSPYQNSENEGKDNKNSIKSPAVDSSQDRRASLPVNALLKDEPRQAWNANLRRRVSGKVEMPKHSKKYRHYPVSCEFCNKKFQPGPLMRHIQERHPDEHLSPSMRGKGKIQEEETQDDEHLALEKERQKKKKARGMPRQLKICYICGRLYGSQSLKIHEPQCLKKWRIENLKLPKHKRMPEPIKPEAFKVTDFGEKLPGSKGYDHQLPDLNAEAEAAYQSHLRNLVPCEYCKRKFNPDRVMVHENACIEKKRTSILP